MKSEGESSAGLRERERARERGEGEAHFLLRTQGRKFMNGSHLSSCSKCKQHTWTKKNELWAQANAPTAEAFSPLFRTKSKSSDMFRLFLIK